MGVFSTGEILGSLAHPDVKTMQDIMNKDDFKARIIPYPRALIYITQ